MAASDTLVTQAIIAFDIGLGLAVEDQRLRGIQRRPTNYFAVDHPVQQVQHMGLCQHMRAAVGDVCDLSPTGDCLQSPIGKTGPEHPLPGS